MLQWLSCYVSQNILHPYLSPHNDKAQKQNSHDISSWLKMYMYIWEFFCYEGYKHTQHGNVNSRCFIMGNYIKSMAIGN